MKALRTVVIAATFMLGACAGPPFGHFEGKVDTRWIDDRKMELLSDFAYVDAGKVRWDAPSGSVVDGASIPQVFWSFIGGPFEGKYRDASVIHDVACEQKTRDWQAVHWMFYEACRCGGVSELKAKVMYSAVYHFGPRWGANLEPETQLESVDDFERLQLLVTTQPDLKVTQIRQLTSAKLQARIPVLPPRAPADSLAMPHLERAVPPATGSVIDRSGGAGRLILRVPTDRTPVEAKEELNRIRATAADSIEVRAADIETRLDLEKNPEVRARLARQLLGLRREKAAVAGVRVMVGDTRHP